MIDNHAAQKVLSEQIKNGLRQLDQGHKDQALEIFETIMRSPVPEDLSLRSSLGTLALQLNELPQAVELFSSIIAKEPDNVAILDKLGVTYIRLQRPSEAKFFLLRALAIDPDHTSALINYGALLSNLKHFSEAITYLVRAQPRAPDSSVLFITLTNCFNATGEPDLALEYAKKAVRIEPNNSYMVYTLGNLYYERGNNSEAQKHFEKCLQITKDFGPPYHGLASVKKYKETDMPVATKMETVLKEEALTAECRGFIHFALGKIYDDMGRWDQAFLHFRQGNLLKKISKKLSPPYQKFSRLSRITSPRIKAQQFSSNSSDIPVFVLGMPRSGSTLVERIITSHPQADTVGEFAYMDKFIDSIFVPFNKPKLQIEQQLGREKLDQYANEYLTSLTKDKPPGFLRIVDKTPGNYAYIGFIRLLFPNARFIHTIRHPLDTCLSCYFQTFEYLHWTSDLSLLAEGYCYYRKAMAYWKKVLPENTIIDVHYENVVTDPENEARRIIAAIGLEWDPVCLDFFKSSEGHSVRTTSAWQVRQPVYQSSKMRWLNYAKHLKPLAQGIKPYLSVEDIQLLEERGVKLDPTLMMDFLRKLTRLTVPEN